MGGGNGCKSQQKRLRNLEKVAKPPGAASQLKNNSASQTIACKICMQTFVCTSAEKVLKEHWENRHPKADFYDAFPHLKA